jgi:ankyrin repeat protein
MRMLFRHGAADCVNVRSTGGMSALAYATERNYEVAVSMLLRHGADPGAPYVLYWALRNRNARLAGRLLRLGADPAQAGPFTETSAAGAQVSS